MKLAYIDSCIWITQIEGLSVHQTIIDRKLSDLAQEGWTSCISEMVLLEALLKPLKNSQAELVQKYRDLFKTTRMLKNYSNVFKDALQIAQTENLNVVDSIHVAIAKHYGCQFFVSSDPHFRDLKIIPPFWVDLSESFTK